MSSHRDRRARKGIVPLARNAKLWRSTGWRVLQWCTVCFTIMGFMASFAGLAGSGGITLNGQIIEGWSGVWLVTVGCAVAGFLFGLVWLLIFKTLALASR